MSVLLQGKRWHGLKFNMQQLEVVLQGKRWRRLTSGKQQHLPSQLDCDLHPGGHQLGATPDSAAVKKPRKPSECRAPTLNPNPSHTLGEG